MKLLVMCEGPNEKVLMDMLLEAGRLNFCEDDLLGLSIYHARQIAKSAQVRTELNIYPGQVKVLRIGDKQSDKLVIPKTYKGKITDVQKYCTKPELEMLLIIAEGLVNEFEKVKSKTSPKEFAKARIKYNKKNYDNSSKFFKDYFGQDIDKLVDSIKKYSELKGKTHEKDELCLEELLR